MEVKIICSFEEFVKLNTLLDEELSFNVKKQQKYTCSNRRRKDFRLEKILSVLSNDYLSTKEVFAKLKVQQKSYQFGYKTLDRDLHFLLLEDKVFLEKRKTVDCVKLFWRLF